MYLHIRQLIKSKDRKIIYEVNKMGGPHSCTNSTVSLQSWFQQNMLNIGTRHLFDHHRRIRQVKKNLVFDHTLNILYCLPCIEPPNSLLNKSVHVLQVCTLLLFPLLFSQCISCNRGGPDFDGAGDFRLCR